MKLIKSLVLSSLLLAVFFIVGCNETPTSSNEIVGTNQQLSKTASSAVLHIFNTSANVQTVNIYGISSDWTEMGVTWNNQPSIYGTLEGSFVTNVSNDWLSADITGLVNKWLNGTYINRGLLLSTTGTNAERFDSREGTNKPYLVINYSDGSETVLDIADAFVNQLTPDINAGANEYLYAGIVGGYDKKSLIRFDIEPTQNGGCTLTPGYWKTHSINGPAPYDDTWLQVGENTTFFLSGKTYYQVLWTAPRGNAYYNLSFHYIAAKLNQLNGADFSDAQVAFDQATILFETYTPAQIAVLKGNNSLRQQFISLAGVLGNYNEGIIGPGHCD